jgi:WXG100 family type VII secretion target
MVMSKAHVDPMELRKFAGDLNRFSQEVQGLLASLNGKMRSLEQSWRDQEQRKFAEAFQHTSKQVANFLEAAHEHAQLLNKKAAVIEDYLKQR